MGNQGSLSVARVLTGIRRSPSLGIAVVLGVVMAARQPVDAQCGGGCVQGGAD
jgi:hypothetical protein